MHSHPTSLRSRVCGVTLRGLACIFLTKLHICERWYLFNASRPKARASGLWTRAQLPSRFCASPHLVAPIYESGHLHATNLPASLCSWWIMMVVINSKKFPIPSYPRHTRARPKAAQPLGYYHFSKRGYYYYCSTHSYLENWCQFTLGNFSHYFDWACPSSITFCQQKKKTLFLLLFVPFCQHW